MVMPHSRYERVLHWLIAKLQGEADRLDRAAWAKAYPDVYDKDGLK
jgi:hypothetical protein